jgi:hypothetical protein
MLTKTVKCEVGAGEAYFLVSFSNASGNPASLVPARSHQLGKFIPVQRLIEEFPDKLIALGLFAVIFVQ